MPSVILTSKSSTKEHKKNLEKWPLRDSDVLLLESCLRKCYIGIYFSGCISFCRGKLRASD